MGQIANQMLVELIYRFKERNKEKKEAKNKDEKEQEGANRKEEKKK